MLEAEWSRKAWPTTAIPLEVEMARKFRNGSSDATAANWKIMKNGSTQSLFARVILNWQKRNYFHLKSERVHFTPLWVHCVSVSREKLHKSPRETDNEIHDCHLRRCCRGTCRVATCGMTDGKCETLCIVRLHIPRAVKDDGTATTKFI